MTDESRSGYRGRFAPSPTGPLHLGSLVAAAASYLDARAAGGEWLVRMEDLDTPRVVAGAADSILRDLEAFGFEWDGPIPDKVMVQSERIDVYRAALESLKERGLAYGCGCSRKDLEGERYPGTCARGLAEGKVARAWRVRVGEEFVAPEAAELAREVAEAIGDFVLLRADGIFAYQLAVVVDDAAQGITDVVRGADLLDSTPRQIYLQKLFGYPTPRYLHVPVVLAADGQKLSKQTGAEALDTARASELLGEALRFLRHAPPPELEGAPIEELWSWAVGAWDRRRVVI